MTTKIQAWGNSQGLRLSKELLLQAKLEVGDEVSIDTSNDAIIIKKVKKFSLEEMVKQIPEDYESEEVDFGAPMGNEAW